MRALVLNYQDDEHARLAKDEYLFGPDLLVAPVIEQNISRPVYLPAGQWLNLFTGEAINGGQTIIASAPLDTIPVYARAGAILPKIPEDIMTLVPQSESGNKDIKTLDDRRVYELFGPTAPDGTTITDFEGRTLTRSGKTLSIAGESVAHIILRFRFQNPAAVTVNGKPAQLKAGSFGPEVEFDYAGPTSVAWQ